MTRGTSSRGTSSRGTSSRGSSSPSPMPMKKPTILDLALDPPFSIDNSLFEKIKSFFDHTRHDSIPDKILNCLSDEGLELSIVQKIFNNIAKCRRITDEDARIWTA